MLFWRRVEYLDWPEYASLIGEMDDLLWRSRVREKSLANL